MAHRNLYFYSDPHFGHANCIKYCNRPFDDKAEMTKKLIENYNKTVGPNDVCIWVGDCFMTSKSEARSILKSLNGKKILVLGNHDNGRESMMNLGFDFACYEMWLRLDGHSVQVKHYPFKPPWWKLLTLWMRGVNLRYMERRPKNKGQFLIHGHTHSKVRFRDRQIHVGVDAWGFRPVSAGQIIKYIREVDPIQRPTKPKKEHASRKQIDKEKASE